MWIFLPHGRTLYGTSPRSRKAVALRGLQNQFFSLNWDQFCGCFLRFLGGASDRCRPAHTRSLISRHQQHDISKEVICTFCRRQSFVIQELAPSALPHKVASCMGSALFSHVHTPHAHADRRADVSRPWRSTAVPVLEREGVGELLSAPVAPG